MKNITIEQLIEILQEVEGGSPDSDQLSLPLLWPVPYYYPSKHPLLSYRLQYRECESDKQTSGEIGLWLVYRALRSEREKIILPTTNTRHGTGIKQRFRQKCNAIKALLHEEYDKIGCEHPTECQGYQVSFNGKLAFGCQYWTDRGCRYKAPGFKTPIDRVAIK